MKQTLAAIAALSITVSIGAQGQAQTQSPSRNFIPDFVFTGSSLAGWTPLGQARWSANADLITGDGSSGAGWLISDAVLQDMSVYAKFRCQSACETGLLLRAERTADGGLKGYLVPLGANNPDAVIQVTVNKDGDITSRKTLARPTSFTRFMAPAGYPSNIASLGVPGIAQARGPGISPSAPLKAPVIPAGGTPEQATPNTSPPPPLRPMVLPPVPFTPGQWNEVNVVIDANEVRATVNWRPSLGAGNTTEDEAQSYGPVALYVGKGSSVEFNQVAQKDLGAQVMPSEILSPNFKLQRLDDFSYAWDAAVADINRDGSNDIIAGPYYYMGPRYEARREIYLGHTLSPGTEFAQNMVTLAADFTGDGWPDVLATESRQMVLYVNPQNAKRRWNRHVVAPGIMSELVVMRDIDGDGKPELVFLQDSKLTIAKPDPRDPTKPWPVFFISEPLPFLAHGYGLGDIDGDGKMDVLNTNGWWKQPAAGIYSGLWTYHAYYTPPAGEKPYVGGGNMSVADVNGDGLADFIASLNAHGFGLAWFEQKRSASGDITFERRMIMDDFTTQNPGGLTISQLHAGVEIADLNGDGVVDFVTGKRFWAHLDSYMDADPHGPAYLVWYRGVKDRKAPGGVRFQPEVIHNRSGVGSSFKVDDVNKDGKPDIVTSSTRGTFVFWGKKNGRTYN